MAIGLGLRLHLWRENQAMAAHVLSQQGALDGQVLLLCDTTDEVGGPLSRVLAEKAGCAKEFADQGRKIAARGTEVQTAIVVLPTVLVAELVAVTNPSIAAALRTPPTPGHVHVVVIGGGGTTLLVTPKPKRARTVGVG